MKQTAVDWLIEELVNQKLVKIDKLSTYYWYKNYATHFELLCENARRMEKEQIMLACGVGYKDGILYANGKEWIYETVEQYYNETYKKD